MFFKEVRFTSIGIDNKLFDVQNEYFLIRIMSTGYLVMTALLMMEDSTPSIYLKIRFFSGSSKSC